MPRPPRGGSWKAEYAQRLRRNRGLPTQVARGHGPVPTAVARRLERQMEGRPRALPVATQVKYRSGIGRYEKKYHGGLRTGHPVNLVFPSLRSARGYLKTFLNISPDSDYVQIEGEGNEWTIYLLR